MILNGEREKVKPFNDSTNHLKKVFWPELFVGGKF